MIPRNTALGFFIGEVPKEHHARLFEQKCSGATEFVRDSSAPSGSWAGASSDGNYSNNAFYRTRNLAIDFIPVPGETKKGLGVLREHSDARNKTIQDILAMSADAQSPRYRDLRVGFSVLELPSDLLPRFLDARERGELEFLDCRSGWIPSSRSRHPSSAVLFRWPAAPDPIIAAEKIVSLTYYDDSNYKDEAARVLNHVPPTPTQNNQPEQHKQQGQPETAAQERTPMATCSIPKVETVVLVDNWRIDSFTNDTIVSYIRSQKAAIEELEKMNDVPVSRITAEIERRKAVLADFIKAADALPATK